MVYPLNANKECDFSWLILLNRNQYLIQMCRRWDIWNGRGGTCQAFSPLLFDVGSARRGLSKGQGSANRGSSLCKASPDRERGCGPRCPWVGLGVCTEALKPRTVTTSFPRCSKPRRQVLRVCGREKIKEGQEQGRVVFISPFYKGSCEFEQWLQGS